MGKIFPLERPGRNPDLELKRLNRRFARVSGSLDRRSHVRWIARNAALILLLLVGAGIVGWEYSSLKASSGRPVSMEQFAGHLWSAANCNSARMVGLAPSRRGHPGYWSHLDADDDGIACEPYPR
jgi:hypothetical protein